MQDDTPLLETDGLTRRYGGLTAVAGVDARIDAGELVGVIGPNGAGKTTFFNLVTGYAKPSSGRVRFRGRDITGLHATQVARLGVSRTFQNLRVFPTMTVFDNVSVGAAGALGYGAWRALLRADPGGRAGEITERTQRALEWTGLSDVAGELAANLPYGRRKYLEIARALATHPTLLFLDEPAAGLNDTETAGLARFIRDLRADGITIVVVEHDMRFIMGVCARIIVLAAGAKIADGTPAQVSADPRVRSAYLGTETAA